MDTSCISKSSEPSFISLSTAQNYLSNINVIGNYKNLCPYKNRLLNEEIPDTSFNTSAQPPFISQPTFIPSSSYVPSSLPPSHRFSHPSSLTPYQIISTPSEAPNTYPISYNLSQVNQLNSCPSNIEPSYIDHHTILQHGSKYSSSSPPVSTPESGKESSEKRHRSLKRPVPDEQKDDRYKVKRAKNNDAAKRSRDLKRMKEFEDEKKLTKITDELTMLIEEAKKLEECCELMKIDLNSKLGMTFIN